MSTPESNPLQSRLAGSIVSHVNASWQMRYGIACVVTLAAFLLRFVLFGHLDTRLPFAFFLLGVMIVAWYGGLGPALFAVVAGLLLGGYFFLPRTGSSLAMGDAERTAILIFVVNGALVSFLMDNLHARIKKLECAASQRLGKKSDAES